MPIKIHVNPSPGHLTLLLKRPDLTQQNVQVVVRDIYREVAARGDDALRDYTSRFDGVSISDLRVSLDEFEQSEGQVSDLVKNSISIAKDNIEKFHTSQWREVHQIETSPGVVCWSKQVPIQKVGLYIPGGTAPLLSTVLMLAVPAVVAGCEEIVLCSPPDKGGSIHPTILYAAKLCGINKVFKVGGAQAIAAMVCGTESIPKVDKLFGPGNAYVTEAKMQAMNKGVAYDLPAGPSEVMIVADDDSNPTFVAADMLAQMEHGVDSQAITLCSKETVAIEIQKEFNRLVLSLPRKEIILKAAVNSPIIVISDEEILLKVMNDYAAEHLIIQTERPEEMASKVKNAGSVFIGPYSPESAGDYASGTNHTLPTYGYAKAFSGLNLDSFMKQITFQRLSRDGAAAIGPTVIAMAREERLEAHALAMEVRLNEEKTTI